MKYMLVNVGPGSLQVDLHTPNPSYNKKNLHRPGPVVALSIPRGESVDILPHFGGSVEKAHESVKYSRDALRLLKPNLLHTYVCDDDGKPVDMEKLFGIKEEAVSDHDKESPPAPKPSEDVTKPDMGQGAVLAAVDQHEAVAAGEASEPAAEETSEPAVEETGLLDDQGQEVAETTEETTEATPDNLTEIKGIGEATAQKLVEAGLTTFAAVAESGLDVLTEALGSKSKAKDAQKQAKKLVK